MKTIKKDRVVVAMSGGVDSSAAAYILKDQGYEVIGVTMRLWELESGAKVAEKPCCSLEAAEDARRVCQILDIPHYTTNFEDIFKKKVVEYFEREYLRGRTPNPCIACNRYVKFAALLEFALSLEARYLATGHYARVSYDDERERYLLYRSRYEAKDQSYALYTLTQEQLAHVLFPVGEYKKEEIRELAKKAGLPTARKAESQEICFVPGDDYRGFLKMQVGEEIRPGEIVDREGSVLGTHRGMPFYTIGQRRGLGISADKPLYVVEIDSENNRIVVGDKEEVYDHGLIAEDVNLIAFDKFPHKLNVKAKIRYNAPEVPAVAYPHREGFRLEFAEPQRAVTPGQAVVLYERDLVLGGGIIERALV